MTLPQEYLMRMQQRLGKDFPAFLQCYENPPYKGLRVNTLKLSAEEFSRISPFPLGERIGGSGFYIQEEKPGADVCHFAGLYYLQEPSAMTVAEGAGRYGAGRVLDLCAAPGGKTTQLAAGMQGAGILIANEVNYPRAKILSQNVERMGITNCAVISASPATLSERFPAYFDLIVADAPCSGEGMFRKDPDAISQWSEANVRMCAERQRGILDEAAKMVAGGGHLIYSTCTFSEEEDEGQIEDFLRRHSEFALEGQRKLYPHEFKGEGHFCAVLKKREGERAKKRAFPVLRNLQAEKAFCAFREDFFTEPPQGTLHTLADGRMYLLPADMPDLSGASLLRAGVELGIWDGKLFKPAHALAMASKRENVRRFVSLPRGAAEKYLRGETVETDLGGGWCVVGVEDYPLGLGKAVNGTVKNHLPKGLRKIT